MEYREFVEEVKDHGGLGSSEDAERAIEATLTTLAERVSADDTKDIALMLPRELRGILQQPLGRGWRNHQVDVELSGPTPSHSDQRGNRIAVRDELGSSRDEREIRRGGIPMDRQTFIERVGSRERCEPGEAERHVAAVFSALTHAITREQVVYMREHLLHGELDDLFPSEKQGKGRGKGKIDESPPGRRDTPDGGHGGGRGSRRGGSKKS